MAKIIFTNPFILCLRWLDVVLMDHLFTRFDQFHFISMLIDLYKRKKSVRREEESSKKQLGTLDLNGVPILFITTQINLEANP